MDKVQPVTTWSRGRRLPSVALIGLHVSLLALVFSCTVGNGLRVPANAPGGASRGRLPAFSHIFVIVMENREYTNVIGSLDAPTVNALAHSYGLATAYYAVAHPSLPNYVALLGGDTFGITKDCTRCYLNSPNLVDELEAGHKTWRAYMQSQPKSCFIGNSPPYAQKHNPFIYFDDIRTSAARCRQIVPLGRLRYDLANRRTPDFVWITPNLCFDMHDCSAQRGDKWLSTWVLRILASTAWKRGGVLFITWDEGTTNHGCCRYAQGGHIPTLVISPLGKRHYRSSTPYDHYSLLRTITDAWGLPALGHAASPEVQPLTDFFSGSQ